MARPEYQPEDDRDRLIRNTLIDPEKGIRDHAILRLPYGLPMRPIELIRLKTSDLSDDAGKVFARRDRIGVF